MASPGSKLGIRQEEAHLGPHGNWYPRRPAGTINSPDRLSFLVVLRVIRLRGGLSP